METVKPLKQQCMLDTAIEKGGTVECVFEIAGGIDAAIMDRLPPSFDIPELEVTNANVLNYYRRYGIRPVSNAEQLQQGIDYWVIGKDFIVT